MLSALALNGVVLHTTPTRQVIEVTGLIGLSPARRNVRVRPTASGSIDQTRYRDEQIVTIAGDTSGLGGSIDQAISEFRLISAALSSTYETPGLLTWTEGVAGLALQRTVKLVSAVEPALREAAAIVPYGAVLACPDPTAYSQTLITVVGAALAASTGGATFPRTFPVTFAPGGSGAAIFTNAGNATTYPLLRLFGLCENPSVAVAGGRRITLNGIISLGEYIEIDLLGRTLTRVNGSVRTSARAMLKSSQSQWFGLPSGATTVQILSATNGASAHLEIVGRSAYT